MNVCRLGTCSSDKLVEFVEVAAIDVELAWRLNRGNILLVAQTINVQFGLLDWRFVLERVESSLCDDVRGLVCIHKSHGGVGGTFVDCARTVIDYHI